MKEVAVAAAIKMIGQGFINLSTALGVAPEVNEDLHEATKEQEEVVKTRAGRAPVVNINAAKEQKTEKPEKPAGYPAPALKALGKLDLTEATRPELKEVAEALGVYQQGQKASELREALAAILKQQSAPAPAAAKGKKAAPVVEDDEPEEPTYPDTKTMKKEFKLFCKVNREAIEGEQPQFFDEDDDSDNPEERLHQIVADETLLKTAWRDNVWDTKQKGEWDDVLREAEALVS